MLMIMKEKHEDMERKAMARAALELEPTPDNPDAVAQVRLEDLPDEVLREIATTPWRTQRA